MNEKVLLVDSVVHERESETLARTVRASADVAMGYANRNATSTQKQSLHERVIKLNKRLEDLLQSYTNLSGNIKSFQDGCTVKLNHETDLQSESSEDDDFITDLDQDAVDSDHEKVLLELSKTLEKQRESADGRSSETSESFASKVVEEVEETKTPIDDQIAPGISTRSHMVGDYSTAINSFSWSPCAYDADFDSTICSEDNSNGGIPRDINLVSASNCHISKADSTMSLLGLIGDVSDCSLNDDDYCTDAEDPFQSHSEWLMSDAYFKTEREDNFEQGENLENGENFDPFLGNESDQYEFYCEISDEHQNGKSNEFGISPPSHDHDKASTPVGADRPSLKPGADIVVDEFSWTTDESFSEFELVEGDHEQDTSTILCPFSNELLNAQEFSSVGQNVVSSVLNSREQHCLEPVDVIGDLQPFANGIKDPHDSHYRSKFIESTGYCSDNTDHPQATRSKYDLKSGLENREKAVTRNGDVIFGDSYAENDVTEGCKEKKVFESEMQDDASAIRIDSGIGSIHLIGGKAYLSGTYTKNRFERSLVDQFTAQTNAMGGYHSPSYSDKSPENGSQNQDRCLPNENQYTNNKSEENEPKNDVCGTGTTKVTDLSSDDITRIQALAKFHLRALLKANGLHLKKKKRSNRERISKSKDCRLFGASLSSLQTEEMGNRNIQVPKILKELLTFLDLYGLKEEGIFRISGSFSRVKSMKEELDDCYKKDLPFSWHSRDANDVATILKQFLRDLPMPLLSEIEDTLLKIMRLKDKKLELEAMNYLVLLLPGINQNILMALLEFLRKVVCHSSFNKMDVDNISKVIAPNLFSDPKDRESRKVLQKMSTAKEILKILIENQEFLFAVPDFIIEQLRLSNAAGCDLKVKKNIKKLMKLHQREINESKKEEKIKNNEKLDYTPVIHVKLQNKHVGIQVGKHATVGDVIAKLLKKKELREEIESTIGLKTILHQVGDCNLLKNEIISHSLYEQGGNIGQRRLESRANFHAIHAVNPDAQWVLMRNQN